MTKVLLLSSLFSTMLFSSTVSRMCKDLQKAEAKIIELAYYDANESQARTFCYFLSRAINSNEGKKLGIDGLLMGSIEYCALGESKNLQLLAKELTQAIESSKKCFSEIGQ